MGVGGIKERLPQPPVVLFCTTELSSSPSSPSPPFSPSLPNPYWPEKMQSLTTRGSLSMWLKQLHNKYKIAKAKCTVSILLNIDGGAGRKKSYYLCAVKMSKIIA
jgi:hypothetical protein